MASAIDDEIAVARRHIMEGEQRIARQKALIEALTVAGYDKMDAELFLGTLERSLTVMHQHLQLLLAERAGWL